MSSSAAIPRLLVSVRDATEARAALRGGADIIDIKEPACGSLGRADEKVARDIVCAVHSESPAIPISSALGEVTEACFAADYMVPTGIEYAKLGLSGIGRLPDWANDNWRGARTAFEAARRTRLCWIAVVYADGAGAPPAHDVIQAAFRTHCAGVLVDTFDKNAGGVFAHLSVTDLQKYAEQTRVRRLLFGIAGRLQVDDLPKLVDIAPDIVAIRSAGCVAGNRSLRIDENQIRRFSRSMQEAFGLLPQPQ